MRGGGGLIRDRKKPSRPDIYKKNTLYHFILPLYVCSLIRDLTEPFRPHILSVLRFLQCLDVLLCCVYGPDGVKSSRWGGGVVGGVGFRSDLRGAADKSFLHYIDDLISVRWFISMGLMGWNRRLPDCKFVLDLCAVNFNVELTTQ